MVEPNRSLLKAWQAGFCHLPLWSESWEMDGCKVQCFGSQCYHYHGLLHFSFFRQIEALICWATLGPTVLDPYQADCHRVVAIQTLVPKNASHFCSSDQTRDLPNKHVVLQSQDSSIGTNCVRISSCAVVCFDDNGRHTSE